MRLERTSITVLPDPLTFQRLPSLQPPRSGAADLTRPAQTPFAQSLLGEFETRITNAGRLSCGSGEPGRARKMALLGRLDRQTAALALSGAAGFAALARIAWRVSVRRYTSASS